MNNSVQETTAQTVVKVENLTKDYGRGRGIFDICFEVKKGEVFGYCGTNGSGKTTTLRNIMGFIKPDSGSVSVYGVNPWTNGEEVKDRIGYLPGEIAFPAVESGSEFLKIQAEMIGLTDMTKAERIINMMQLDPTAPLKRMSKGMKQKTAIVSAFMHSPDLIILDEPTTGLDPLMRKEFISLIKEEKARGATIIMSNHMFDELEQTCDRVAFIKDGKIIDIVDMSSINEREERDYVLGFFEKEDFNAFNADICNVIEKNENLLTITVRINVKDTTGIIEEVTKHNLKFIKEEKYSLEKYFKKRLGAQDNE